MHKEGWAGMGRGVAGVEVEDMVLVGAAHTCLVVRANSEHAAHPHSPNTVVMQVLADCHARWHHILVDESQVGTERGGVAVIEQRGSAAKWIVLRYAGRLTSFLGRGHGARYCV